MILSAEQVRERQLMCANKQLCFITLKPLASEDCISVLNLPNGCSNEIPIFIMLRFMK